MAPSACIDLRPGERAHLLGVARASIDCGLHRGCALPIDDADIDETLAARLGVFVTLTRQSALRGCIGSLESAEPLPRTVAESAYGAAFRDPRFPRLEAAELSEVSIEISVLSAMVPVRAASREALLAELAPAADGLLLEDGAHRSTFLPKVWEQLPEPAHFLEQLMIKAGLPANHWSPGLRFYRYGATCFSETLAGTPV